MAGGFADLTQFAADAEVYSPDGGCQLKVKASVFKTPEGHS
jgi:hypothetical protein